jgi:hypothetical protein
MSEAGTAEASADAAKVPSEADQKAANKEKIKRMERQEQLQAEEAANAAAKVKGPAVNAKGPQLVDPMPTDKPYQLPLVAIRDRSLYEETHTKHLVVCRGASPSEAQESRYLWPLHGKLKRYDEVVLRGDAFAWELPVRIMYIDLELQLVIQSPIGPLVEHDITARGKIDWAQVTIENKGSVNQWCVYFGRSLLRAGFSTQVEAKNWVDTKRLIGAA